VNRKCHFIHTWSLKISFTVPLSPTILLCMSKPKKSFDKFIITNLRLNMILNSLLNGVVFIKSTKVSRNLINNTIIYSTFKGQSVYYSTRGDFWKYLNREFIFHLTIKIHNTFIVCRITFFTGGLILSKSFIKQYFIVNKRFWENWEKFKIHKTSP